jgi:hypothetical protein
MTEPAATDAAAATRLPGVRERPLMTPAGILIGYARCSTEKPDLTAQRQILRELGVAEDRIYLDHGLTGRNRSRPGLTNALAALREGDTLVVPKLDRLARSVPDARAIGDSLAARDVRLSLGGRSMTPNDPMGKCFFNILATFAELRSTCSRFRPVNPATGYRRRTDPATRPRVPAVRWSLAREHGSRRPRIAGMLCLGSRPG